MQRHYHLVEVHDSHYWGVADNGDVLTAADGMPVVLACLPIPTELRKKSGGGNDGHDADSYTKPGMRWITIHPHGNKEADGQPVLIRENPDGTAHVVAGAGGKITGLKLTNLRSGDEIRRDQAERQKEKRAADRARKDEQAPEQQEAEGEARKRLTQLSAKKTIDYVNQMAEVVGLPKETLDKLNAKPKGLAEGLAQHRLAVHLASQINKTLANAKKTLAIDTDAAVEKGVGSEVAEQDQTASEAIGYADDRRRRAAAMVERGTVDKVVKEYADTDAAAAVIAARVANDATFVKDLQVLGLDTSKEPREVAKEVAQRIAVDGEFAKAIDGIDTDASLKRSIVKHYEQGNKFADSARRFGDNFAEKKGGTQNQLIRGMHKDVQQLEAVLADHPEHLTPDLAKRVERMRAFAAMAEGIYPQQVKGPDGKAEWVAIDDPAQIDAVSKAYISMARVKMALAHKETRRINEEKGVQATPFNTDAMSADKLKEALKRHNQYKSEQGEIRKLKAQLSEGKVPQAFHVEVKDVTDEDITRELEREKSITESREALTGLLAQNETLGGVAKHKSIGAYDSLNQASLTIAKQPLVDRELVDYLGPAAAAQMLATHFRASLSAQDFADLRTGLQTYHSQTAVPDAQKAHAQAGKLIAEAAALQIAGPAETPDDLARMQANIAKHQELMNQARREAGIGLGKIEGMAALSHALDTVDPANGIRTVVHGDYEANLQRLRAMGFGSGDFKLESVDPQNHNLTIRRDAIGKVITPQDPDVIDRYVGAMAVKNGERDEDGWLPHGFAARPQSTFIDPQSDPESLRLHPDVNAIAEAKEPDDVKAAVRGYIAGRMADGQDPVSIVRDMHNQVWLSSIGYKHDENDPRFLAIDDVFYNEVMADSTDPKFGEKIKANCQKIADDWYAKQDEATKELSLPHQQLDAEPTAIKEALHRTLASFPLGAAAMKDGDAMTPQDSAALRTYFVRHVAKLTDEAIAAKPVTDEDVKHTQDPMSLFGVDDQPSLFGDDGGGQDSLFGDQPSMFDDIPVEDSGKPTDALVRAHGNSPARAIAAFKGHQDHLAYQQFIKANPDAEAKAAAYRKWMATPEDQREGPAPDQVKLPARGEASPEVAEWLATQPNIFEAAQHVGGLHQEHIERQEREAKSASAWGAYVRIMGGQKQAMAALKEHARGEVMSRFAKNYAQVTGKTLKVGHSDIPHGPEFGTMIGGDGTLDINGLRERAAEVSRQRAIDASKYRNRDTKGQYDEGAVKDVKDGRQRRDNWHWPTTVAPDGRVQRLTIGAQAEKALMEHGADVVRNIDPLGPGATVRTNSMSGKYSPQQRAVKLALQNGGLGLHFGAGSGKTGTMIGIATQGMHEGKFDKSIMAVPSIVQKQFGEEMLTFCEPGQYRFMATPGASMEERLDALRGDPKKDGAHMVVLTHQGLRDTLMHLYAKDGGFGTGKGDQKDIAVAAQHFLSLPKEKRPAELARVLRQQGINPERLNVSIDEAHDLSNRDGKMDSRTAAVIDALAGMSACRVYATGTPLKNADASEAFDALQKCAPDKYPDSAKQAFLQRYKGDGLATKEALQREIAPYFYALRIPTGVARADEDTTIKLTPQQQADHDKVMDAYKRVRLAKARGTADVDAMRTLAPTAFEGLNPQEAENLTRRLQAKGTATLRDSALNRVINNAPSEHNAKIHHLVELATKTHAGKPGIVFAHYLNSAQQTKAALEAKGLRVGYIDGAMNGNDKAKVRNGFQPKQGDPEFDVLVVTDAGATGMNLQRGEWLAHLDIPMTAKNHEQRSARVDRLGQTKPVTIHNLIADVPMEHKAFKRLKHKYDYAQIAQAEANNLDDSGLARAIRDARNGRAVAPMKAEAPNAD